MNTIDCTELASGGYGNVYRIVDRADTNYPDKVIKCNRTLGYDFWRHISEFDIHNMLNGRPGIAKMVGCCLKKDLPECIPTYPNSDSVFIMIQSGTMDLVNWIDSMSGRYDEYRYKWAKRIAFDIAIGLYQIHQFGVVHRDIKLNNVIIFHFCEYDCASTNGNIKYCSGCSFSAKIIDFGAATFVTGHKLANDVSTFEYRAPECWKKLYYDDKSDIWSYYIILCYLMIGKHPYIIYPNSSESNAIAEIISSRLAHNENGISNILSQSDMAKYDMPIANNMHHKINSFYRDKIIKDHEQFYQDIDSLVDLIKMCSMINPPNRARSASIVNHPWFNDIPNILKISLKSRHLKDVRREQMIKIRNNSSRRAVMGIASVYIADAIVRPCGYRELCHAIRVFDICNMHRLDNPVIIFHLCIYIFVKFFSLLETPIKFSKIYKSDKTDSELASLERMIMHKYLDSKIYHPSVYEYCVSSNSKDTETLVIKALRALTEPSAHGKLPSELVNENK